MVVDLHGEKTELFQPPMRAGEIGDVNLYVMAVVRLLRRVGLAEVAVLFLTHLHAGLADVRGRRHGRERAHHLAIETGDALRRARTDVELDIGHAQHDAAEAALVRRMHGDAVAPGACGFDAVIAFAEVELRSLQRLA